MRGGAKPAGHQRFEDVDEEEAENSACGEKEQAVEG
jgi:hypothetical protein